MDKYMEYYGKLPLTRQQEILKMLRLNILMKEGGASASELRRQMGYSRYVARTANYYYRHAMQEFGMNVLIKKYHKVRKFNFTTDDISKWVEILIKEETNGN